MKILQTLTLLIFLIPVSTEAFDWRYEGRYRGTAQGIFDAPRGFTHSSTELEARNGFIGTLWEKDDYVIDYEFTTDLIYTGGIREQSGWVEEYDAEIFRAWVRLEKDNLKVRAGRQQILFGAGALFRPLGFFDTRVISGIVPLTRGVDGLRTTYFTSDTSLLENWIVPADISDRLIIGFRGERLLGGIEAGVALQYHPVTDLDFLSLFNRELLQMGYHLKGEKEIGFWNESRLDIQLDAPGKPMRLDTVVGADYTFDVGQGLHVLAEYFISAQERGFVRTDLKNERLIQLIGAQLDQPVGIDIVWRLFMFYDLTDQSFQIAPQIEYNVIDQVFLYVHGNIGGSIDGNNATGRLFRQAPVFTGTESSIGVTLMAYL